VQMAWKLLGGETTKITLRNGFEITTTSEHKYIVLEDSDYKEKQAGELKLGDRIVCPRRLKHESNLDIKKEILERISGKNFYVRLNQDFGNKVKHMLLKFGVSNFKTALKPRSLYHGSWQYRYHITDLMNLRKTFNFDIEELYEGIETIQFRSGKQRGKSSNDMKLPRKFEDFCYLAGLFTGDGCNKKFIVGKKELGDRFEEICSELGVSVTFREYDRTPEIVTNQTLVEVLNSLFAYPLQKKSHNVRVSEFLWKSPNKYVSKFIRGYFDTDGCVEKSRRAVTLSSASKQMIDDLHLLLLRFGCIAIKEKDNTLTISGNSAVNFTKEIGFGVKYKEEKANMLVKSINYSYVSDTIKVGNQVMCIKKVINNKINNDELAFIEVKKIEQTYEDVVYDFTVKDNHNFLAEGMIIHNTTFSDNLLLGAGMISEELAGKQLSLDFHEDEKERGITIDAANVSMIHNVGDKEFLINLIDTPGHVDFGGDVTRAMRACDGAIVLVCAVEGIMPQTETVLKQALRERVKPILFINKVDRLIKEVKLTPEAMQQKFIKIITDVNKLIKSIAPEEYKEKWQVNVQEGSVAFGSAFHKWGLSVPYMQKQGISFSDIIEAYNSEKQTELARRAPMYQVVLDIVTRHHPNPKQAQAYRIPRIWQGDLESSLGKSLLSCDPNGEVAFVVTKIVVDKHAGEVAAGRLFSGTVKQGQEIYMIGAKRKLRVQQVNIYKGAQRFQVESAVAGNIVGLIGLKDAFAGETVSSIEMEPFEAIKHIFEPVVTKSIEAKKASDLPKLVEVLRQVNKEDPSIFVSINEETGENLIAGMGELHLEVVENRIKKEKGVDVKTSNPIVVYRESILKNSREIEGKSPNKHNKFYFTVEPIPDNVYEAIKSGEILDGRIKKTDRELWDKFVKLGYEMKEARSIKQIFNGNILIDSSKGIVHIGEVIELIMDGFEQVMREGPLAREPGIKMVVRLKDTTLHEDAIHRGPSQVLPAVRESIRGAMIDAQAILFEPLQILQVDIPAEYLGEISKLIGNKRGQLLTVEQEGVHITCKIKLPVAEMFGLSNDLRSATEGRGSFFVVDQAFERLPAELQDKVVKQIRQRKGIREQ